MSKIYTVTDRGRGCPRGTDAHHSSADLSPCAKTVFHTLCNASGSTTSYRNWRSQVPCFSSPLFVDARDIRGPPPALGRSYLIPSRPHWRSPLVFTPLFPLALFDIGAMLKPGNPGSFALALPVFAARLIIASRAHGFASVSAASPILYPSSSRYAFAH